MKSNRLWIVPAVIVVLSALGWTQLSQYFVYGQGHADRPILPFLAIYAAAWTSLVVGCLAAARYGPPRLGVVIVAAAAARLVLWPSGLILENDVYRYVLDGKVLLEGGNPYRHAPLVVGELGGLKVQESLRSPEARRVLERIGHPHIPTIYPPAAQWVFAAGAAVGGWSWKGQRAVFLVIEAAAVALLIVLLGRLGLEPGWVFVYAWNPLALKEIANSVHLDVLVLFWLAAALLCLDAGRRRPGSLLTAAAGVAVGMAVLSKLYPVVIIPPLVASLWRCCGARSLALPTAAGVTVALGYLPFAAAGWSTLTAGLSAYTADWNMNQGAFGFLQLATGDRAAAYLLVGLAAAGLPLLIGSGASLRTLTDRVFVSLLLWFLLIPAPFPWYVVPLAGIGVAGAGRFAGWAGVFISGPLALYYLSFYYEYRGFSESWWWSTRLLEHVLIWSGLVLLAAFVRSRGAPGPRPRPSA